MQAYETLPISIGSIIGNKYKVESVLGEGGFGFVVKCLNIETEEYVAVKVNRNHPEVFHQALKEIEMLKKLRVLDPETSNIIGWKGFFFHKTNICMVFELLDKSLYDYGQQLGEDLLPLSDVRSIIDQLNIALSHIHSMGIIHADLKTENVMVVNERQKPLKVKLIDFGLAYSTNTQPGDCVQTPMYKAPEVILGCPFNKAIDMWTLGHLAAELAVGQPLYYSEMEHDVLKFIVDTQGQPPDHVLNQGRYTNCFFHPQEDGPQHWEARRPEEFEEKYKVKFSDTRLMKLTSLDDLVELMDDIRGQCKDNALLVDLIKGLMHLDPEKRIKSQEVHQHPFMSECLPQPSCDQTPPGPEVIHHIFQSNMSNLPAEPDINSREELVIHPDSEVENVGWFRGIFNNVRETFNTYIFG